jgi:hypothetical protein
MVDYLAANVQYKNILTNNFPNVAAYRNISDVFRNIRQKKDRRHLQCIIIVHHWGRKQKHCPMPSYEE